MRSLKKEVMIYRWSLITAGAIALFWSVWRLIVGEVPTLSEIKLGGNCVLELPFNVSRWWDILTGPIWSALFIIILKSEIIEKEKNKSLAFGLGFGLFVGLGLAPGFILMSVSGPFDLLGFSAVVSFSFALIFALGIGLVFGPTNFDLNVAIGIALGIALDAGLALSLSFGLIFGLVFGPVFGLGFVSGVGLGVGLAAILSFGKHLFLKKSWHKAKEKLENWFLVR